MYDICIVGAGPAGATLARILSDRFRVLLLDSGRKKCCAGILAPEAQKMLARLDLALPKTVLADPQPFAVAVLDLNSNLIRHYSRQYVNIDRYALDRWFLSLVPDIVDVRSNAIYRSSDPESHRTESRTIHFSRGEENHSERVRFLIGADGAASTVRREFFPRYCAAKRYLAVQHWFSEDIVSGSRNGTNLPINFLGDYVGIFDTEITDFYAWTVPKDGQLIVGGAMPFGSPVRERIEKLKKKLEPFGLSFGPPTLREAGQLVRPRSTSAICLGSDKICLVGEAAGLISPSSAEGISSALFSAMALAEAFESGVFRAARYRKLLVSLYWSIWRKNIKSPGMFHPWLRKQVMRLGLTSLDK